MHVNPAENDLYMNSDSFAPLRPATSLGVSRSRPELAPLSSTGKSVRSSKSLSKSSLRNGVGSARSPSRESVSGGGSLMNEPWLVLQMDQDFGQPSVHSMKPESRERFTQHLMGRVDQIKREYEWMPSSTASQSTFKAQLGADLFQMRRCLWRMQDQDEPDAKSLAEGTYQD
jgi:hypothetical protein